MNIRSAQRVGEWQIDGPLAIDPLNISGVALVGDHLILGSDEGNAIQFLRRVGEGHYRAFPDGLVELDAGSREIDIEELAWRAPWLYVIGSHARKRKKVRPSDSLTENRARIAEIDRERDREQLFRLRLDPTGRPLPRTIERISLAKLFKEDPILAPFREIPSKENGLDIEGLAIGPQGELVIGLRGPVLRGNLNPVVVVRLPEGRFDSDGLEYELRFLDLGGRGIRSIANYGERFLLLAGPVGGSDLPFHLYLWDGTDLLPGRDAPDPAKHLRLLCEIPLPHPDAKAEAMELLEGLDRSAGEDLTGFENLSGLAPGGLRLLVLFDGLENGAPTVYDCPLA